MIEDIHGDDVREVGGSAQNRNGEIEGWDDEDDDIINVKGKTFRVPM